LDVSDAASRTLGAGMSAYRYDTYKPLSSPVAGSPIGRHIYSPKTSPRPYSPRIGGLGSSPVSVRTALNFDADIRPSPEQYMIETPSTDLSLELLRIRHTTATETAAEESRLLTLALEASREADDNLARARRVYPSYCHYEEAVAREMAAKAASARARSVAANEAAAQASTAYAITCRVRVEEVADTASARAHALAEEAADRAKAAARARLARREYTYADELSYVAADAHAARAAQLDAMVASDARVRGLEAELSREAARRFSIESENAMLKMRLANAEDFRRGFLHGYRTY